MTLTVRGICTFAVFLSVSRPFCRFTLAFEGHFGGGRNKIRRREKWPKESWEEGEIGGKSREEGEKEK